MNKFESQNAPEPVGLYPHAKQVGNLLFLSGIGPRERGKKEIPGVELDQNGNIISYDIAVQCHSVFKNVRTVLEDAGSNWDNLVDEDGVTKKEYGNSNDLIFNCLASYKYENLTINLDAMHHIHTCNTNSIICKDKEHECSCKDVDNKILLPIHQ